MSLVPWKNKGNVPARGDLSSSLSEFRNEMDRLFDSFFREPMEAFSQRWGDAAWSPSLDVEENDQSVIVRAEVPGVDPKDLDISVTENQLVLSGEKKETSEKKDKDYYHRESRFGSFRRAVTLPSGVETEGVEAEHANGVLTITLKKSQAASAKKIPIKSA